MAIGFNPIAPWYWAIGTAAAVVLVIMVSRFFVDRGRALAHFPGARIGVLLSSAAALGFLTLSAYNPVWQRPAEPTAVHLAVVVDVSDSVLRRQGGWPLIQEEVARFLTASLTNETVELVEHGEASVISFRGGTTVNRSSLADVVDLLQNVDESDFAGGGGSDIGAGLARARAEISASGGRGAVLLVTDGHDTVNKGLDAATDLARLGISITVFPVASNQPEISLASINLAPRVNASEPTLLRGVIWNQSAQLAETNLEIQQNPGLDLKDPGLFGPSLGVNAPVPNLEPGTYGRLRPPLIFEGVGLQFVDVILQDKTSSVLQQRRFFTYVQKPIELLAIGGDNRWVSAVSEDIAQITQITPEQLDDIVDLERFDGIIISDVAAEEFANSQLSNMATAVSDHGLGMFIINGDHRGADEEADSVLRTYHETSIDQLLPLSTEPRPFTPEPPPRQVVMLIDASGSMSGWPLAKAKEIATHIVLELLRPQDRLDVIAFTSGAHHLVNQQLMDAAGKANAIAQINSIGVGGGTDPSQALALVRDRMMSNCGLIFLSDGEFGASAVRQRPDCRATVFAIRNGGVPSNSPLFALSDPFAAGQSFSPIDIEIPYFDPEPRDKFFEAGNYVPLTLAQTVSGRNFPPVPEVNLEGNAITYLREGNELVAIRPKFIDPILAFGEANAGYVGVFTSGFTPDWLNSSAGQEAIQEWIMRIVPYAVRDRYHFDLRDDGQHLSIKLGLRTEDGVVPDVNQLSAHIKVGESIDQVDMKPVLGEPATFTGQIQLSRLDAAQLGRLVITEIGPDALARAQQIPILIPKKGVLNLDVDSEAQNFGLNDPFLAEISAIGSGQYDPQVATFFGSSLPDSKGTPLWPWLVVAAAGCYLLAIFLRRLRGNYV